MNFRWLRYGILAATLGTGIGIGYSLRGNSNELVSSKNESSLEERTEEINLNPKNNSEKKAEIPSLATNTNYLQTIEEKKKELEEKILKYESENALLKKDIGDLRKFVGVYDFSELKEPEGRTLEERFRNGPEYYLSKPQESYENILELVDKAIADYDFSQPGSPIPYKTPDGSFFQIKFYTKMGMMGIWREDNKRSYRVDVDLRRNMTSVEPFSLMNKIELRLDNLMKPYESGVAKYMNLELTVTANQNKNFRSFLSLSYNETIDSIVDKKATSTNSNFAIDEIAVPSSRQRFAELLKNIMQNIDKGMDKK
ncbi:MAG TPA: hypothetical protein VJC07_02835 [Candidatus Nanoarchaeia archaeon]|nr:hypothetical protein [Candidatus Nanoarchaeia archaeon]